MNWEQRRMLERAGLLRRRTPSHLLTEGDDEGGDDIFGGDDEGGDDLFGDDEGGEEGEDASGEGGEGDGAGAGRKPPEELKPKDIEKFGSPRFLDVETKLKRMFSDAMTSASVGAQSVEAYPGNAIPEEEHTPAKTVDEEEEVEETEDTGDEEAETEEEDKNESFYRYGNRRDKWLINEATRLLLEAEDEGAAADEFDMERFTTELADYMENIHNTEDIEAGIFNNARQMILNNFGQATEQEFVDMLAAVTDGKYDFLGVNSEVQETPIAVGASAAAAGA